MTEHNEKPEWFHSHEADDQRNFDAINARLDKMPTEMEEVLHKVFRAYLLNQGGKVRAGIIATAVIVGSVAVIGGGLKFILGWLGFTYLGR